MHVEIRTEYDETQGQHIGTVISAENHVLFSTREPMEADVYIDCMQFCDEHPEYDVLRFKRETQGRFCF